jgi:hypothetical protein
LQRRTICFSRSKAYTCSFITRVHLSINSETRLTPTKEFSAIPKLSRGFYASLFKPWVIFPNLFLFLPETPYKYQ